tara:strand:- start:3122 stop:3646 length:525 start_codon:yes stop_codon:yes gene_type:complete
MEIVNNSTIDSVIDYANVKFGLELKKDDVMEQLKSLSFGDTLNLLDSIKNEDNDKFSSIIDLSRVNEVELDEYGTINTAKPSNATIRASNNGNDQRDFTNAQQDAKRDSSNPQRYVAGSNKQPTGQGANRASTNPDPDDVQRAQNSQTAGQAANQANVNAQEIERLKQLAMGGR